MVGGGEKGRERERERAKFTLFLPDLPSVDLLPPKVISDLRDVAAYYHESLADNQSGNYTPHETNYDECPFPLLSYCYFQT